MIGPKGVVVDAQPLGDAGPEAFDHHVGEARQFTGIIPAFPGLQVEDDAFLAAIPLDRSRRVPEFFAAGRLHLDHLGAEVGHHHGGDAAGPAAGEVKNRDAIKYLCHGSPSVVGRPIARQMRTPAGQGIESFAPIPRHGAL